MVAKLLAATVLLLGVLAVQQARAGEPDYTYGFAVGHMVAVDPAALADSEMAGIPFDAYHNTEGLPKPCPGMIQHDCVTQVVALTVAAVQELKTIRATDPDYDTGHLIVQNDARKVQDALGTLFSLTVGYSDDLDLVMDAQKTLKAALVDFQARADRDEALQRQLAMFRHVLTTP